jgi:beta-glucanase (GH16 family)
MMSTLPEVCSQAGPSGNDQCAFLSGALSSHDKFNMTYGYVEGRMKTSGTSGALSSFYLYHRYPGEGVNLHAPEIDIVEYLGENPFGDEDAFQTYHFADVNTGEIRSAPTMEHKNPSGDLYSDEFHTYGVLWEPQLVIWYIDGVEIKRLSGPQVSRQGMNIVTYLVAGSGWAPTPDINGNFPIQYQVDYIRAFQRDAYKTNGLYPQ